MLPRTSKRSSTPTQRKLESWAEGVGVTNVVSDRKLPPYSVMLHDADIRLQRIRRGSVKTKCDLSTCHSKRRDGSRTTKPYAQAKTQLRFFRASKCQISTERHYFSSNSSSSLFLVTNPYSMHTFIRINRMLLLPPNRLRRPMRFHARDVKRLGNRVWGLSVVLVCSVRKSSLAAVFRIQRMLPVSSLAAF
jgi:hypothetical protein